MFTAGDFGDHAVPSGVERDLGSDDVGADSVAIGDYGCGAFVAGRFYA
jgi:hypothetical protein